MDNPRLIRLSAINKKLDEVAFQYDEMPYYNGQPHGDKKKILAAGALGAGALGGGYVGHDAVMRNYGGIATSALRETPPSRLTKGLRSEARREIPGAYGALTKDAGAYGKGLLSKLWKSAKRLPSMVGLSEKQQRLITLNSKLDGVVKFNANCYPNIKFKSKKIDPKKLEEFKKKRQEKK